MDNFDEHCLECQRNPGPEHSEKCSICNNSIHAGNSRPEALVSLVAIARRKAMAMVNKTNEKIEAVVVHRSRKKSKLADTRDARLRKKIIKSLAVQADAETLRDHLTIESWKRESESCTPAVLVRLIKKNIGIIHIHTNKKIQQHSARSNTYHILQYHVRAIYL